VSERVILPAVTTQQMVEVDRLMIEEYGILLIQMMENAGRNLAELARRWLGGKIAGNRVVFLCGAGNNGGGGMVAARHLHNWGAEVSLKVVAEPDKIKEAPAQQLRILRAMRIYDSPVVSLESADLVVDALLGYGLSGNPRGPMATWIDRINTCGRAVLALDSPSGLNTTTGVPGDPCVRATATLTLALPKTGLMAPQAKPYTGELYLADIGVPPELYKAPTLGLNVGAIFAHDTILCLEG
jgi:NAD(P)H-hydrate epimerase